MAILHEFKLPVGWNKADAVFRFELAEFNALVELAVIDGYCTFTTAGSVATKLHY